MSGDTFLFIKNDYIVIDNIENYLSRDNEILMKKISNDFLEIEVQKNNTKYINNTLFLKSGSHLWIHGGNISFKGKGYVYCILKGKRELNIKQNKKVKLECCIEERDSFKIELFGNPKNSYYEIDDYGNYLYFKDCENYKSKNTESTILTFKKYKNGKNFFSEDEIMIKDIIE